MIKSSKIPSNFQDCKIAFLTDLHSNTYGLNNIKLIQLIEDQNPDFIMITGDMIIGSKNFDSMTALQLLKTLSKKYKIFYSMGNHEQKLEQFEETKNTSFLEYKNKLINWGICLLDNQSISLTRSGQSICITGVTIDMEYYGKVWKRIKMNPEYLKSIVGSTDKNKFHMLMAHNPKYFKQYASWGADLVLSGHVHGGVMILPKIGGIIAPDYRIFPKYDFGKFEENQSTMILSRGLGTHTIKLRIRNLPELAIITLHGN